MSQRTSKKQTIDGTEYEVFMLPPKKARRILVEMTKVIGPALGGIAGKGDLGKLMDSDVSGIDWQAAISGLTEKLSDEMLDDHMSEFAKVTQVTGKGYLSEVFDAHFTGAVDSMFKWYWFALKVNFGNFFSALESASAPLITAAKAKAAKESESPST